MLLAPNHVVFHMLFHFIQSRTKRYRLRLLLSIIKINTENLMSVTQIFRKFRIGKNCSLEFHTQSQQCMIVTSIYL